MTSRVQTFPMSPDERDALSRLLMSTDPGPNAFVFIAKVRTSNSLELGNAEIAALNLLLDAAVRREGLLAITNVAYFYQKFNGCDPQEHLKMLMASQMAPLGNRESQFN